MRGNRPDAARSSSKGARQHPRSALRKSGSRFSREARSTLLESISLQLSDFTQLQADPDVETPRSSCGAVGVKRPSALGAYRVRQRVANSRQPMSMSLPAILTARHSCPHSLMRFLLALGSIGG